MMMALLLSKFSPIISCEEKDEIKVIRNSLKKYPTHGRQRAKYYKYKEGRMKAKSRESTHSSYRCTPNPKDMFFSSVQSMCAKKKERRFGKDDTHDYMILRIAQILLKAFCNLIVIIPHVLAHY